MKKVNKAKKIVTNLTSFFIALTCAISAGFLIFAVDSSIKPLLVVVAIGPMISSAVLVYKNWIG